jgi:hypothetical protein
LLFLGLCRYHSADVQLLLNTAALRSICHLANVPSETLVMNALWALNNAMFKSSEADKRTIVEALGVRTLIKYVTCPSDSQTDNQTGISSSSRGSKHPGSGYNPELPR